MPILVPMSHCSGRVTFSCLLALALFASPAAASGGKPDVKLSSTPASSITATSARVTAIVTAASPSTFHVEIGRTTAYGFTTTEHVNRVLGPAVVWVTIYGMAPSTTYHFRTVATNADGTREGDDASFTTLASTGTASVELLSEVDPAPLPPAAPADSPDPLAVPDLAPPLVPDSTATESSTSTADGSGAAAVLLPEESRTVVVAPVSGTIAVQAPAGSSFTGMNVAEQIPVGSIVDARHGMLELTADTGAAIDTGRFWGSIFRVDQPSAAKGITELTLVRGRPARCGRKGAARAVKKSGPVGGLWGKDHNGRFRTRGRNSVATVRGTVWYVAERCAGTLTRVIKGEVAVRDTRTGRTVVVKAGRHLMVRDRRRSSGHG